MKNTMAGVAAFTSVALQCSALHYDATIDGKEILTPLPKTAPQINGAPVFGVRPGKPVFYHVAVSGQTPLTYGAEGLPQGMQIDPGTGWITGRAPKAAGDYEISLKAENCRGKAEKKLILRVGDTLCLTPPMGWNSWYVHSEGISEKAIRDIASAMREKGLDQFGWTYINIDDCWMGERDLWRQKDIGALKRSFSVTLNPHGAGLFKFGGSAQQAQ